MHLFPTCKTCEIRLFKAIFWNVCKHHISVDLTGGFYIFNIVNIEKSEFGSAYVGPRCCKAAVSFSSVKRRIKGLKKCEQKANPPQ